MPYFRPRMACELYIPELSGKIDTRSSEQADGFYAFSLPVLSARLVRNDHAHADELTLTFDYRTIPIDPRFVRNAVVKFWMGNADDSGNWSPSNGPPDDPLDHGNLRFIGMATKPARRAGDGDAPVFECSFLDYTTRFLMQKPFPTAGIPDLAQTLEDAWKRICDNVGWYNPDTKKIDSAVVGLRDRLVFSKDITSPPRLADAVTKRFAKLGKVVVKPNTDAWAVWQQCCGMCGLISYIYLDHCIVTTADNYFHPETSAQFTWGKNILSFNESRNDLMTQGVCATSYDPLSRRSLEAFWPPVGDPSVKKKHMVAHTRKVQPPSAALEDRVYFPVAGVSDPAKLLQISRRIWEERSRQELEGCFTTKDMVASTASGGTKDVLDIGPGDGVIVAFDPDMISSLTSIPNVDDKIAFLLRRGIPQDTAEVLAASITDLVGQPAEFLVKSVSTQFDSTPEGQAPSFEIHFCNRIDLTSSANTS